MELWSLEEKPELIFGLNAEFYMVSAGFVEFGCAYLLIFRALSVRASAMVLQFFFVSAIYDFGLIDAIGHAVIIVVLTLLMIAKNPFAFSSQSYRPMTVVPPHIGWFFIALFAHISFYEGAYVLSCNLYKDA